MIQDDKMFMIILWFMMRLIIDDCRLKIEDCRLKMIENNKMMQDKKSLHSML
jgi:hypothetical protein